MKLYNLFESAAISDQLIETYRRDFNEWPLHAPLGRYDKRDIPISVQKRREMSRSSIAGSGSLQRFLFGQSSWKNVPPRDFSIFTTTSPNEGTFAEFGVRGAYKSYMIIPRNGTKIALIRNDFNDASIRLGDRSFEVSDLTGFLMMDHIKWLNDKYDVYPLGIKTLHSAMQAVKALRRAGYDVDGDENLRAIRTLTDQVESGKEITPEDLGIEVVTTSTYVEPSAPHEAWFSDDYICIPEADWEAFKDKVK